MISTTFDDGIAWLTMDDGKANAVSFALLEAIAPELDRVEKEAKAVVIAGRPGCFSGGFDLKVINAGGDAVQRLMVGGARLALRLLESKLPVVAACSGHAIAMGALLLCAADTRIGVEGSFRIGLNETQIGAVLPPFALELARERLSKRHLQRAAIQAVLYDPAGAVDAGFLDTVVAPDELAKAAREEATRLAALDANAYAGTKLALRAAQIERIRSSLPTS
ncbi:MAG: crotonase/enoyl-CoA hydratase family protein [Myxococcota bacterium]